MKFHFRHHDHHHHHHVGSSVVVQPAAHPSALIIIDAHACHGPQSSPAHDGRSAEYGGEYSRESYALDASRHRGKFTHRPTSPMKKTTSPSPAPATATVVSVSATYTACSSPTSSPGSTASPSGMTTSPPPSPSPRSVDGVSSPSAIKRALHLEHHESECPVANPDPHSRPRSRQFFRLGRHKYKAIHKPAGMSGNRSDSSDDELSHSERTHGNGRRMSKTIAGLRKPKLRRAQSMPGIASKATVDKKTSSVPANADGIDRMSASERRASSHSDLPTLQERLSKSERTIPASRVHRRSVTFTCVQIREYNTILGDHPCCPSGPPLSLGWKLERENSMEFETYEEEREPMRCTSKEQMRLGGEERRGILQSLVVSSPSVSGGAGGEETSSNDESDSSKPSSQCCVYSQQDLRRAERRLTRDRSNNSRACRRMNRGFFKPLTPEECERNGANTSVVGNATTSPEESSPKEEAMPSPMKEESDCNDNEECKMDISPIKSISSAMDDDR